MINALLAIIDRLIQLRQYRTARIEKAFKELFEPLFNDLLMIHGDYIKIFRETSNLLPWGLTAEIYNGVTITEEDRCKAFTKAIIHLRERRKEFEPVRIKVRSLTEELTLISTEFIEPAQDYINAVMHYFPQGTVDTNVGWPSPALLLLEFLEENRPLEDSFAGDTRIYEQARDTVRHNIRVQEESWSRLCIAFAKLKIAAATTDYLMSRAHITPRYTGQKR
jgi:hypothetical protein